MENSFIETKEIGKSNAESIKKDRVREQKKAFFSCKQLKTL